MECKFTSTDPALFITKEVLYTVSILSVLFSISGVVGNATIILAVCYSEQFSKLYKLFNMQVCISNIILAAIIYPLFTKQLFTGCKTISPDISDTAGNITSIMSFSQLSCGSCMLGLMLLAVIRYRKIVHSMCNRSEKSRSNHIMIALWAGSLFVVLVPKALQTTKVFANDLFQTIYPFFFWYVCPVILISFTYIRTKIFSKSGLATEWRKGSGHTALVTNITFRHKKRLRMLSPMVTSAVCLTLPFYIWQLASVFAKSYLINYQHISVISAIFCLIFNTFLMPFLHYKLSSTVPQELRKIYKALKTRMQGKKSTPHEISTCERSHNIRPTIVIPHLHGQDKLTNNNNKDNVDLVMSEIDIEEMISLMTKEPSIVRESIL